MIEITEYPVLTGSNQQIAWANHIRIALIANLCAEISSAPGTPDQVAALTDVYVTIALRQTAATWWIAQVKDAAGSSSIYEVSRKPAAIIGRLRTEADKQAIAALRP
jgi:hypothetical protein